MLKQSNSVGSATPDPVVSAAASQPIPAPSISNKPPAGQTGPRGIQPRQTYSRVNTGAPQTADAGSSAQKGMEPGGLQFLPKLSEAKMTTQATPRPNLNDMVKAAMAGAIDRVSITNEAVRQLGGEVKTASAPTSESLSTELINKLADAVGYVAEQLEKGAAIELSSPASGDTAPGTGPGALTVMRASHEGRVLEPGQSGGKAAPSEPMESGKHGPAPTNAMGTNEDMSHPAQPADPINGKTASDLAASNLARLGKLAEVKEALLPNPGRVKIPVGKLPGVGPGGIAGFGKKVVQEAPSGIATMAKKLSSIDPQYIREVAAQVKAAEDANNPAQISAGKEPGPAASGTASGEAVPAQPADVSAQERLISSNEAAINYTKRDAKRDPISDAGKVYNSPIMKDPVLGQVFENSGKAGVKTSSATDAMKVAAARTLLSKFAADAAKKKSSQMGGAGGAPPPPGIPTPAFTQ